MCIRDSYTAVAPVPIAAFGSSETAATGKAFLKGYVGVCLEGAVIVLSCLCLLYTSILNMSIDLHL